MVEVWGDPRVRDCWVSEEMREWGRREGKAGRDGECEAEAAG